MVLDLYLPVIVTVVVVVVVLFVLFVLIVGSVCFVAGPVTLAVVVIVVVCRSPPSRRPVPLGGVVARPTIALPPLLGGGAGQPESADRSFLILRPAVPHALLAACHRRLPRRETQPIQDVTLRMYGPRSHPVIRCGRAFVQFQDTLQQVSQLFRGRTRSAGPASWRRHSPTNRDVYETARRLGRRTDCGCAGI